MADVTGQIGSEYVELDNAATETTLQELLEATLTMSRRATKARTDDGKKIREMYDNLTRLSAAERQEMMARIQNDRLSAAASRRKEKAEKKLKEEAKDQSEKTRKYWTVAKKAVDAFTKSIQKTIGIVNDIANWGDSISSTTKIFGEVPVVGGVLANAFGAVAGAAEKTQESFIKSASVGANFNGSISKLVNSAAQAGLTFNQFAGVLAKNGNQLALLGQGASDGAVRFTKLSKEMKGVITSSGLAQLGYTTEEVNNSMLRYLGREAKSRNVRKMTDQQLINSTVTYLKNLDAVSKLTGETKDSLQAEHDAQMADAKMRLAYGKMGPKAASEVRAFIDSLPTKEMKTAAKEMITGGVPLSKSSQQFAAINQKATQELLKMHSSLVTANTIPTNMITGAYKTFVDETRQLAKSGTIETLSNYVDSWNTTMVGTLELASRSDTNLAKILDNISNSFDKNTDGMADALVDSKKKIAKTSDEFTIMLASHLPQYTNLLDKLLTGLNKFSKWVTDNSDTFSAIGKWMGDGLVSVLNWFVSHKDEIITAFNGVKNAALGIWNWWKSVIGENGNDVASNLNAAAIAIKDAALLFAGVKILKWGTSIAGAVRKALAARAIVSGGAALAGEAGGAAVAGGLGSAAIASIASVIIPIALTAAGAAGAAYLGNKLNNWLNEKEVSKDVSNETLLDKLSLLDNNKDRNSGWESEADTTRRNNIIDALLKRGVHATRGTYEKDGMFYGKNKYSGWYDPAKHKEGIPDKGPGNTLTSLKPEVKPEVKPVEIKPEVKPVEIKPEVKPVEIKPEVKPVDLNPVTVKPVDLNPVAVKPVEIKPEVKPVDLNPVAVKPVEIKPEVKPVDLNPVAVNPVDLNPVVVKPVQTEIAKVESVKVKPVDLNPVDVKPVDLNPVAVKPVQLISPPTADITSSIKQYITDAFNMKMDNIVSGWQNKNIASAEKTNKETLANYIENASKKQKEENIARQKDLLVTAKKETDNQKSNNIEVPFTNEINQKDNINGVDGLNTRLDTLIAMMSGLADINRRQLTVQKGLSTNAFS